MNHPNHWRLCRPCSKLAFRHIVMAAQKKLKPLKVQPDEQRGSSSPEMEGFVASREVGFKTMIRNVNRTNEDTEKLVDTFFLLTEMMEMVAKARNGKTASSFEDDHIDVESLEGESNSREGVSKLRNPKCESCRIYLRNQVPPYVKGEYRLPDMWLIPFHTNRAQHFLQILTEKQSGSGGKMCFAPDSQVQTEHHANANRLSSTGGKSI